MSDALELLRGLLASDEPLSPDTALDDVPEWDSLSAMSFIALAKQQFNRTIKLGDLKHARTVADLLALLG